MLQLLTKIKSVEDVRLLIGARPRAKNVIMCHGVFDVVHPGHIRHLLYAKSKADILIASLTADRHISKGVYRPYVPQDMRATNLATFEMVDYVIIDDNAEPFDNLRLLQPDYFAKGFEYTVSGGTKTAMESEIVRGYGGEVLFTPGDVVYSSSKLIELAPPDLKFAKLHSLMQRTGISFDGLRQTLDAMQDYRVHVVGDTIVDTITHCDMIGASNKTPTLSVCIQRSEDFVGGAAIVAKHCRAAGAQVALSTVLGNDRYGEFVVNDLIQADIELFHHVDLARPTTHKNVISVAGYRLLKLDTVDNRAISGRTLKDLQLGVQESHMDAAIFSDFRHGIFNHNSTPVLIAAPHADCFRVADSQVASRWGNICDFKDFDLICPNEREARFALGDQDSGIRALAWGLYEAARCKCLILKLGERGVLAKAHGGDGFVVDSFVDDRVDPVGAGDALLAYATLSMLVAKDPIRATILGVFAASVACERDGNVPVGVDEVRAKVADVESRI